MLGEPFNAGAWSYSEICNPREDRQPKRELVQPANYTQALATAKKAEADEPAERARVAAELAAKQQAEAEKPRQRGLFA